MIERFLDAVNRWSLTWWPDVIFLTIVGIMAIAFASYAYGATPDSPTGVTCGENCVEYVQGIRVIETGTDVENCWGQQDECPDCGNTNYWDFEVLEFPGGMQATLAVNEIEKAEPGDVTHCQVWLPERAGLYSIRARACNEEGCSRWSESWNADHTNHPDGFVYYIKLAAPTGGGIE